MRCRFRLLAFTIFVIGSFAAGRGLSAAPDEPVSLGTASGTVSIDGKTIELKHAYAMNQPTSFDEKKTDTAILLTDKPVPDSQLAAARSLERVGRDEIHNSVLLEIDENGRATREVIHHEALGGTTLQISGMTQSTLQIASRTGERIDATARTDGPQDFLKHKYEIRVHFAAAIRAARRDPAPPDEKTGRRLPEDGGEPGKAYFAFQELVRRRDIDAIKKLKPAGMPDIPDEELKAGLEIMAAMMPEEITIDEGFVDGDAAVLYVSATQDGHKQYGTARLTRQNGVWLPNGEKWSDRPRER